MRIAINNKTNEVVCDTIDSEIEKPLRIGEQLLHSLIQVHDESIKVELSTEGLSGAVDRSCFQK